MTGLHVQNLCVKFGDNTVLENLNLIVKEGEFLVLLGPSGCGKSTLLHSIAGLNDVSSGSILIDDMDVTHVDPTHRGIGMVFQSYALYPNMSVERNLSFGLRVNGTPKSVIHERVQKIAQMLQLQELLNRKPFQLSGGQRQRVAIGRALAREARICLCDEPLSNLDAQLRSELRRELKILHQKLGSTMVYVTHDQVEAMSLATQLVVMRKGKVQQIGTSSLFSVVNTRLVQKLDTNEAGQFSAALEAGTYSVFVRKGGAFFANQFDEKNNIGICRVEVGKQTRIQISVNNDATY
jgi:multiple sugar transport system ATP-binding protein